MPRGRFGGKVDEESAEGRGRVSRNVANRRSAKLMIRFADADLGPGVKAASELKEDGGMMTAEGETIVCPGMPAWGERVAGWLVDSRGRGLERGVSVWRKSTWTATRYLLPKYQRVRNTSGEIAWESWNDSGIIL